jgi:hypothetical protein
VHGRRLAHHEILANHKPESPERGDGRLDRSSSADDGWPPPGPVEARLTALERAVEDLDHTLAARRAAAALRMAEQAGARPSDDLMRQPEADEARTLSPVHDHFASADSTNAEPQQVARRQRNGSANDAQAGNGDQRSTENRDRSTDGEDQIK